MKPTITIMCPSRARTNALALAAHSLFDRAAHPDRVELVVRIDADDPARDGYIADADDGHIDTLVVGAPYGYRGLHRYYDDCARAATGDWLFMWNDDVIMLTDGWDEVIDAHAGRFVLLAPETTDHRGEHGTIIPVIPRAWFTAVGHVARNPQSDTWLVEIADALGLYQPVPVLALHDRADLTGNNDDATFAARDHQRDAFYSAEQVAERAADIERLRAWLAGREAPALR